MSSSATASPSTAPRAPARNRGDAGNLRRKVNGVFYTPPRLAEVLAEWALRGQPERVLEPAFGDGVFLRAAHKTLVEAGVPEPTQRLFGVEIDPDGPRRLREAGLELTSEQLRQDDLLALEAKSLGGRFGAIIGNPPYIRHHLMSEELVERGRKGAKRLGIELNGRSDAWAYFCAHLVTFLDSRGRLALVLPGSVLQADYAKPLLNALASERGEVQLVRISERLFVGVQERTVVLLIDRAKPSGGSVIYRQIADLKGLKRALRRPPRRPHAARVDLSDDHQNPRLPWRLTRAEAAVWEEICAEETVTSLGELVKIRIGVVTGANSFFIRSEAEAVALGAAVDSVAIISRGAWLRGPRWTRRAQAKMAEKPSRLVLFPGNESRLIRAARAELRRAEEEGLNLRSHCAKRLPWYSITDTTVPDLFLPYMASQPPRLVSNKAKATCTNAVHRVWLLPQAEPEAESIAAASWTTLYRLSAELVGRSYGGGILKLEPNGATRLVLPMLDVKGLAGEIEAALEVDGIEAARRIADRRLLVDGLGISAKAVAKLQAAAERLEGLRRR